MIVGNDSALESSHDVVGEILFLEREGSFYFMMRKPNTPRACVQRVTVGGRSFDHLQS